MVRDNSSPQQLKKRGFYMVDSSYTIPCNPNSMRDSGPLRNAQYVVHDPAEQDYMRRSQQNFRNMGASSMSMTSFSQMPIKAHELDRMRETLNSRCTHQRPLSSFGGNPANMNGTHTTGFFSTISKQSQQRREYEPTIIDKVTVVRVADYTKNISQGIFSPNLKVKKAESSN